jgi:hypothetical protein
VSEMIKKFIIGGVVLFVALFSSAAVHAQEGGAFSSYLVGTYDLREGYATRIQIVNPTAHSIEILIAFFDDNEKPLRCVKEKLSHNDLLELDVRSLKLPAQLGVIKISSLKDGRPYPGMVGFQRHYFKDVLATESNLAAVPGTVLSGELKIFMSICK